MRGYLAAWASMGWGGGRFVATGVTRGTLNYAGSWSWRLPYALQWIWPVPLVFAVWFAPESPWWLVRKGRYEEAKAVVKRSAAPGFYAPGEIDGYVGESLASSSTFRTSLSLVNKAEISII